MAIRLNQVLNPQHIDSTIPLSHYKIIKFHSLSKIAAFTFIKLQVHISLIIDVRLMVYSLLVITKLVHY